MSGIPRTTVNARDFLDMIRTELVDSYGDTFSSIRPDRNTLVITMPDGIRFRVFVEDMPSVKATREARLAATIRRYHEYFHNSGEMTDDIDRVLADLDSELLRDDQNYIREEL